MTTFTATTYQNEYLAAGDADVNAIVTVTSSGNPASPWPAAGSAPSAAEIIIIDVSGSMSQPRTKIAAARQATAVAIGRVRDGVQFGILAGSEEAAWVYPQGDELAVASAETRAEAVAAVRGLRAGGGTAIGRWLMAAYNRFVASGSGLCHAILLTDGRDQDESAEYLAAAIETCEGAFQCDCRGVGTDWQVNELRTIASRLLGTVDIVADPEGMPADFDAMMREAMGRRTADVALRLWTPRGAQTSLVSQVSPTIEDLTDRGVRVDDRTVDYPTGAWGDEARDYHLCLTVPARAVGEEMLAGRVSLVVDGQVVSQSLVKAIWTDDAAMSTQINAEVAHYTGQAELASAIAEGLAARHAGDDTTATERLGRAAQLATEGGNDGTLRLLSRVVDIEDASTGTVRLRRHVEAADEMALDTRSTKTVRLRSGG